MTFIYKLSHFFFVALSKISHCYYAYIYFLKLESMYYFIIQQHFYIFWRSIFHQKVLILYDCAIACMVIILIRHHFTLFIHLFMDSLLIFFFTHISFLLQRLAFVSVKKSACRKNYSHTFIYQKLFNLLWRNISIFFLLFMSWSREL